MTRARIPSPEFAVLEAALGALRAFGGPRLTESGHAAGRWIVEELVPELRAANPAVRFADYPIPGKGAA